MTGGGRGEQVSDIARKGFNAHSARLNDSAAKSWEEDEERDRVVSLNGHGSSAVAGVENGGEGNGGENIKIIARTNH